MKATDSLKLKKKPKKNHPNQSFQLVHRLSFPRITTSLKYAINHSLTSNRCQLCFISAIEKVSHTETHLNASSVKIKMIFKRIKTIYKKRKNRQDRGRNKTEKEGRHLKEGGDKEDKR